MADDAAEGSRANPLTAVLSHALASAPVGQTATEPVGQTAKHLRRTKPPQQRDGPEGSDAPQPKQRKRKRQSDAERQMYEWTRGIQMAARHADLHQAMATFREVLAAGEVLSRPLFNTLLFITSGGDHWELYARRQPVPAVVDASQDAHVPAVRATAEELVEAAEMVYAQMQAHTVSVDQRGYLALARIEAIKGQPKKALDWVVACQATEQYPVQLRLFHPSLVGYSLTGDVDKAMEIDALITASKLDLEEYEYALLLEATAAAGTYQQLRDLLLRMRLELNRLQPATVEIITSYFRSPRAAEVLEAPPAARVGPLASSTAAYARWQVESCEVDAAGVAPAAGEALQTVDLDRHEWQQFADGVASLAVSNQPAEASGRSSPERPGGGAGSSGRGREFQDFQTWLDLNGPFHAVIDAANVAYFGQNKPTGGFNWQQITAMYSAAKARWPGKQVLVILHKQRTMNSDARQRGVQKFMAELRERREFYETPPGSNDDWYWLYATVHAKAQGMLISNDEMRDHIFSLLRPKHFLKWKVLHNAHYMFTGAPAKNEPVLTMPPLYSPCTQELSSGGWMLPLATEGSPWVCIKPTC